MHLHYDMMQAGRLHLQTTSYVGELCMVRQGFLELSMAILTSYRL